MQCFKASIINPIRKGLFSIWKGAFYIFFCKQAALRISLSSIIIELDANNFFEQVIEFHLDTEHDLLYTVPLK